MTQSDLTPATGGAPLPRVVYARFSIGDVVRHRLFDFRGVVFDVDSTFACSEEYWESIPEPVRPTKDQPFYHLLVDQAEATQTAYVSQQHLVGDDSEEPVDHPALAGLFNGYADGRYRLRREHRH